MISIMLNGSMYAGRRLPAMYTRTSCPNRAIPPIINCVYQAHFSPFLYGSEAMIAALEVVPNIYNPMNWNRSVIWSMTFGLKARICETVTPSNPSSMGIKNKFCKAYTTPIISTMNINADAIFKILLIAITSHNGF